MRRLAPFVVALALPLAVGAKTVEWNEEVTLASGATLRVARTETRGNLPASLPGGQSMQAQSLAFDHAGKRVTWKVDTKSWPMYIQPRGLEILNGEPMLLFAVYAFEACSRFDFPQDAIAALRYRRGAWSAMPRSEIPANARANLLHGAAYSLPRYPQYQGVLVDARVRSDIERSYQVPRSGATLEELSRYFSGRQNALYDHSACRILRRAPDPALDAASERLAAAYRSAPTVRAVAGDLDETRREVPSWRQEGLKWAGQAWLTPGCKGVVEKTGMIARSSGDSRGHTISASGTALVLADTTLNGGRVEMMLDRQLALQLVSCEGARIAILGRRDPSNLVLIRLESNGELHDVTNIVLPEAERLLPQGWAPVWKVEVREDSLQLAIGVFVDYSGERTNTLLRSRSYSVKLPS